MSPERMMASGPFLMALWRRRCNDRARLMVGYHRSRVHPRLPMGPTHAWGPF